MKMKRAVSAPLFEEPYAPGDPGIRQPVQGGMRPAPDLLGSGSLQGAVKGLALLADLYLFPPVPVGSPLADSAVDEPAQVPNLELPGRTPGLAFKGTPFHNPAGAMVPRGIVDPGEEKIDLPLRVNRDGAPPLLITVDRLDRSS